MKLLLIGHGRMGTLVESLAGAHGCEVVGLVTSRSPSDVIETAAEAGVRMAIDFSLPDAVPELLPKLVGCGVSVVVGTTGWQAHEPRLRELVARSTVGVLAASNFAIGVYVFNRAVETAARLMARRADVGAWIHEAHHAMKKDAPSGTARTIEATMRAAGYARGIDVASTRAGSVPGTHTVGFDGPADTITLVHTVRDRSVFAHGALDAARWLEGRQGWFGVEDMFRDSAHERSRS